MYDHFCVGVNAKKRMAKHTLTRQTFGVADVKRDMHMKLDLLMSRVPLATPLE